MSSVSERLLDWFDQHGRHDLPWQKDVDAYRVWVSEIMLQQTQVTTVIPYFERFMDRFTSVTELARADVDEVLHLWSGLGYYARGRNLHRAAKFVVDQYAGIFPRNLEALIALPGIGRSTAGAILALTHGDRHPILDGNVKRVLARYHEIAGWPGETQVLKQLWSQAEKHTPQRRIADYTQAIMDLGATVCMRSKPCCTQCPLRKSCDARAHETQEQFPGRKKRRPLPLKQARFVIARAHDGSTLLHKRPPVGIWGGLWSFPEIEQDEDINIWCRAHGLQQIGATVEHPILTHTFTHFRLAITPLECAVGEKGRSIMDSDQWLWYNIHEPVRVGLSKPVLELLRVDPSPFIREDIT